MTSTGVDTSKAVRLLNQAGITVQAQDDHRPPPDAVEWDEMDPYRCEADWAEVGGL